MPELKRITPGEVLKALTENELTPTQGDYTDVENRKPCACGLSALVIGMGNSFMFVHGITNQEEMIFNSLLKSGYEKDYLIGFVLGFDGKMYGGLEKEKMTLGREDGNAAWQAVKHLAVIE